MTATTYLGKPTARVDGRAKVTGAAKYAAEYPANGLAYGCVVSSTIAKGRITKINTEMPNNVRSINKKRLTR